MKPKQFPRPSPFKLILMLLCVPFVFTQCKRTHGDDAVTSDSTALGDTINASVASADALETSGEPPSDVHDVIEYYGAADSEAKTALLTFSPFDVLHELAKISIHIKDSLESLRGTATLTEPKDSLIFRPYEIKAFKAIMEYKKLMASGSGMQGKCPSLLDLDRTTEEGDSTSTILPPVGPSKVFSHDNFFFLGGAPFITKVMQDDKDVFFDANGNPETRFRIETENASFLLTSITHFKNIKFNITFGPPLDSYDTGPLEVNGVGTIIHTLIDPFPVLMLTKTGLLKGHLRAITINLVPEDRGCVSNLPIPEVACSENLNENDILAVYIPYNSNNVSTCVVTQHRDVWTADLDGDGIADLAGISSSSLGEASGGILREMLWFAYVSGTWQIIDNGSDYDCT